MAITLVSAPSLHQTLFSERPNSSNTNTWFHSSTTTTTLIKHPCKPVIIRLYSSSSTTSVVEETPSPIPPPPDADGVTVQSESSTKNGDELPLSGCKGCGRVEIERGCNGEGRIQGGIAAVPGFGWWPIKAYRPCPGFLATGGRYKRQGQSMDEVAFGRGGKGT